MRIVRDERGGIKDGNPMGHDETSLSLLDRLCLDPDAGSWDRLVAAYSPLLRSWIARYEVQAADADDLVQDVLVVVMRELPSFRHNQQPGAFRTWLRRIVVNRLRNFWRKRDRAAENGRMDLLDRLDELEAPDSAGSRLWDQEHDRHLAKQLLGLLDQRFTESTREVFRRLVLEGADADLLSQELGLTLNAVFTAKSRVLRELRLLGRGLLD
jgi:RNA polymerase sigma-70 factor (ECF subfamily)